MPFDQKLLSAELSNEIAGRPFSYVRAGNKRAKRVVNHNVTIGDFLAKILNHTEGQKDGTAFIPGPIVGSARSADAMSQEHAIGLDIDNGTPIEEIKSAIRRSGIFAAVYSTHSHLKTETEISCKQLTKYHKEVCPSISLEAASVIYLRDVKKYHASILATCVFVGRRVTPDGDAFIIAHQPMHKVRVVLFLDQPFDFIDAAPTLPEAQLKWKALLLGVAKMLGLEIDEACLDPARILYFPRHSRGSRFYTWCNTEGHLLDLRVSPEKLSAL